MIKYRRICLNDRRTPEISITPLRNGLYNIFHEIDGVDLGAFPKERLMSRLGFSEYQLNSLKGTANFVRVK